MADQRNISIKIPKLLLDQIQKRSTLNDRTRNEEFRYLLRMALDLAKDQDVQIKLPVEDWVKSTARIDYETEVAVVSRCRMFERKLGYEIVRLVAYAIQVRTDRDLAVIADLMSRQGRAAAGTPPPVQPEPQPSVPA